MPLTPNLEDFQNLFCGYTRHLDQGDIYILEKVFDYVTMRDIVYHSSREMAYVARTEPIADDYAYKHSALVFFQQLLFSKRIDERFRLPLHLTVGMIRSFTFQQLSWIVYYYEERELKLKNIRIPNVKL